MSPKRNEVAKREREKNEQRVANFSITKHLNILRGGKKFNFIATFNKLCCVNFPSLSLNLFYSIVRSSLLSLSHFLFLFRFLHFFIQINKSTFFFLFSFINARRSTYYARRSPIASYLFYDFLSFAILPFTFFSMAFVHTHSLQFAILMRSFFLAKSFIYLYHSNSLFTSLFSLKFMLWCREKKSSNCSVYSCFLFPFSISKGIQKST